MRCTACGNDGNRLKAHYCGHCGREFSDEERQAAYNRTVYGKIDMLLEAKAWITLSKITDHVLVRIAVLLILGILVLVNIRANGAELAIRSGNDYRLAYSNETDEYYVFTDRESVNLSVYIPRKAESCTVESYVNGTLREKSEAQQNGSVVLQRTENGYFVLKADYGNGDSEEILFFVCREAES